MFMMGNITSSAQLRNEVRQSIDLIGSINYILTTQKVLPKMFAQNYIWIANNYSMDEGMEPLETQGIVNIFMEFIEIFEKDVCDNDEEVLVQIV